MTFKPCLIFTAYQFVSIRSVIQSLFTNCHRRVGILKAFVGMMVGTVEMPFFCVESILFFSFSHRYNPRSAKKR